MEPVPWRSSFKGACARRCVQSRLRALAAGCNRQPSELILLLGPAFAKGVSIRDLYSELSLDPTRDLSPDLGSASSSDPSSDPRSDPSSDRRSPGAFACGALPPSRILDPRIQDPRISESPDPPIAESSSPRIPMTNGPRARIIPSRERPLIPSWETPRPNPQSPSRRTCEKSLAATREVLYEGRYGVRCDALHEGKPKDRCEARSEARAPECFKAKAKASQ